jgi:hypothetical protein
MVNRVYHLDRGFSGSRKSSCVAARRSGCGAGKSFAGHDPPQSKGWPWLTLMCGCGRRRAVTALGEFSASGNKLNLNFGTAGSCERIKGG